MKKKKTICLALMLLAVSAFVFPGMATEPQTIYFHGLSYNLSPNEYASRLTEIFNIHFGVGNDGFSIHMEENKSVNVYGHDARVEVSFRHQETPDGNDIPVCGALIVDYGRALYSLDETDDSYDAPASSVTVYADLFDTLVQTYGPPTGAAFEIRKVNTDEVMYYNFPFIADQMKVDIDLVNQACAGNFDISLYACFENITLMFNHRLDLFDYAQACSIHYMPPGKSYPELNTFFGEHGSYEIPVHQDK